MAVEGQYVAENVAGIAPPVPNRETAPLLIDSQRRLVVVGGGSGFGDATAANQATEITKLTSIDGKLPSALDASGGIKVAEQTAPAYENEGDGVAAVTRKLLVTSSYAPSLAKDWGTVTKALVKSGAGNVFAFTVANANAAVRYFQLHDKATALAGTNVPLYSFPIPIGAGTSGPPLIIDEHFFVGSGAFFSLGISWAISTTQGTFTDSATAAEHSVHIHYR